MGKLKDNFDNDDDFVLGEDVIGDLQSGKLEVGVFGLLYVLVAEVDMGMWFAVGVLLVDFLQLLEFTLSPGYGWSSQIEYAYDYIRYVTVQNPITDLGYQIYIVSFVVLAILLLSSLLICCVVGYYFKTGEFKAVWPIKYVRFVVSVFVSAFFISALKIFLIALACTEVDGESVMTFFPEKPCWRSYHFSLAVSGALCSIAFCLFAFLVSSVTLNNNPRTLDPLGAAHSRTEVQDVVLKTVMSVSDMLLTEYPGWQVILQLGTASLLMYYCYTNVPFYNNYMNKLRGGLYAITLWSAFMLFVLFLCKAPSDPSTIVLAAGSPIIFVVGWFAMERRLRVLDGTLYIEEPEDGDLDAKAIRMKKDFTNPYHFEIALRFVRKYAPPERLTPGALVKPEKRPDDNSEYAINVGEVLVNHAMRQYSENAFVHITCANYLIAYRGRLDAGQGYIDKARRMRPNFIERFCIFVRDQEKKQRQQSMTSSDSGQDLIAYVEFQSHFKGAIASYKNTLRAIREFWKTVNAGQVTVHSMGEAFKTIARAESNTERKYRALLENYPKSVPALRTFARFCDHVKGNTALAQRYRQEAQRQEQLAGDKKRFGGEDEMDVKNDATIIADEKGIIIFCNKAAATIFGWKPDELMGHNLNVLMFEPLSSQHDAYIRAYHETGVARVVGSTRELEGKRRDGTSVDLKINVNRVDSSQGVTFVALIQEITSNDCSKISINAFGKITAINHVCVAMFGYHEPGDLLGKNVSMLMPANIAQHHDGYLERYRRSGVTKVQELGNRHLTGKRSDGSEFPMTIQATLTSGTKDTAMFSAVVEELSSGVGLVTIDAKGKIQTINKHMLTLCGFATSTQIVGKNIKVIVPKPYRDFHDRYLARFKHTQTGHVMDSERRVMLQHVEGILVAVRLKLSKHTDQKGQPAYTGAVTAIDESNEVAEYVIACDGMGIIKRHTAPVGSLIKLSHPTSWDDESTDGGDERLMTFASLNAANFPTSPQPSSKAGGELIGKHIDDVFVEPTSVKSALLIPNIHRGFLTSYGKDHAVIKVEQEGGLYIMHLQLASTMEPLVGMNKNSIITFANPDAHAMFGYADGSLIGKKVNTIMPTDIAKVHDQFVSNYHRTGKINVIGRRRVAAGQRSDHKQVSVCLEMVATDQVAEGLYNGSHYIARIACPHDLPDAETALQIKEAEADHHLHDDHLGASPSRRGSLTAMSQLSSRERDVAPPAGHSDDLDSNRADSPALGVDAAMDQLDELGTLDDEIVSRGELGSPRNPSGAVDVTATFDNVHVASPMMSPRKGADSPPLENTFALSESLQHGRRPTLELDHGSDPSKLSKVSTNADKDQAKPQSTPQFSPARAPSSPPVAKKPDQEGRRKMDDASSVASSDTGSDWQSEVSDGASTKSGSSRLKNIRSMFRINAMRSIQMRLGSRVIWGMCLLVLTHVVTFSVTRSHTDQYVDRANRVRVNGGAAVDCEHICIVVRDMSQHHDAATEVTLREELTPLSSSFADRISDLYLNLPGSAAYSDLRDHYDNPNFVTVNWVSAATGSYVNETVGLWKLARSFSSAVEVLTGPDATPERFPTEWKFILGNGPMLLSDALEEALMMESKAWGDSMPERSMIVGFLMLSEIVVIVVALGVGLLPLVRQLFEERMQLFGCFVSIPRSVIKQVIAQRLDVGEDDSDDESDEDDDEDSVVSAGDWKMQVDKSFADVDVEDAGLSDGVASASAEIAAPKPQKKRIVWDENAVDDEGNTTPVGIGAFGFPKDGAMFMPHEAHGEPDYASMRNLQSVVPVGSHSTASTPAMRLTASKSPSHAASEMQKPGVFKSFWQSVVRVWNRLSYCWSDIQTAISRHQKAARKKKRESKSKKKKAPADRLGTDNSQLTFVLPIVGIIILLLFAMAFSITMVGDGIVDLVDQSARSEQRNYLMWRARLFSHELISTPDVETNKAVLDGILSKMIQVHDELQDEVTRSSDDHARLMFEPGCLRSSPAECLPESHILHKVTTNGVDGLLRFFVSEAQALLLEPIAAINHSSTHITYMDQVYIDLDAGLTTATDLTEGIIMIRVNYDKLVQSLVFAAISLTAAAFYIYVFRPFISHTSAESGRATVLLSHLPDYVDLGELVKTWRRSQARKK